MLVLKDEVRTARKFYACDASELWRNYGPPSDAVNADDRLVLEGVKADKWKIRPGQRYRCVVFRDGRELVTPRDGCTRTIPGCICARDNLGEWCVHRRPASKLHNKP